MTSKPKNALILIATCAISTGASAHNGHGLLGAHWHATDTLGLVVLVNAIAAAVWFARRGK